ncbi:FAH family protein, partial [Streptomyces pseudovenezuelae]
MTASTTVLFECAYQGRRHIGLGLPREGEPLRLVPLGDRNLADLLLAGDDPADAEAVTVPAGEVTLRPPLLPDHPGGALVGGFMQTHNV